MLDPISTAFTGAVVKEATSEVARGPINWMKEWMAGGYLLILGQRRSGKSSFYKFLRTRRLNKQGQSPKTLKSTSSGVFRFNWRDTTITVRNIRDNPGQIGPFEHAKLLFDTAPHVAIIFLDLTTYIPQSIEDEEEDDCLGWFNMFCDSLNDLLAHSTRKSAALIRRRAPQDISAWAAPPPRFLCR